MFKTLDKYDVITLCAFALIMVIWLTSLTVAVVRNQQTPVNDAGAVVTTGEAISDEVPPETETVEPTECTTAPASTVEPIMPSIEDIKPTEPETIKPAEPIEPEVVEPTTNNKVESNNKPSNDNSTTEGKMSETEMLACVIYQEVGGDMHCDECRRRVADVVLNRVADSRFPDSIEEVLTAKNQYGRFYYTGIKWADRHTRPGEKEAVERAWRIAEEVMAGKHSDLYGNGYVWQAGFKQGTSGFWCCGHYFAKGKA